MSIRSDIAAPGKASVCRKHSSSGSSTHRHTPRLTFLFEAAAVALERLKLV